MTKKRMKPDERRRCLLTYGIKLAEKHGFNRVTREQVAEAAGVSVGLVAHYFTTVENMRERIMMSAVRRKNLVVIGQGLALENIHAQNASSELKAKATKLMVS